MTEGRLYELLKQSGLPIAYRCFSKPQTPPYAVYYRTGSESIFADNRVYYSLPEYVLELYTKKRDREPAARLEEILNNNELPYEMTETYLSDEGLIMITYEFSV